MTGSKLMGERLVLKIEKTRPYRRFAMGELSAEILDYLSANPSSSSKLIKDINARPKSVYTALSQLEKKGLLKNVSLSIRKHGHNHALKIWDLFRLRSETDDELDADYAWHRCRSIYYRPEDAELLGVEAVCYLRDKLTPFARYKLKIILAPRFPEKSKKYIESFLDSQRR